MENLTKEILKILKNEHTKVELKEAFKGNYYSYHTDTIYIAKDFKKRKMPKDINKKAAELIVVCHECVHSVQNKYMHILNTIFSNLSIILTIICIAIGMIWTNPLWFKIITSIVILTNIVIRLVLEMGAINGSIEVSQNIVEKSIAKDVCMQDIKDSIGYIKKYKWLALLNMILDKIIFLILVTGIK